jgi:hypothetical protein
MKNKQVYVDTPNVKKGNFQKDRFEAKPFSPVMDAPHIT